ncbi:hypothetical protein [Streptomyces sp. NPDC046985]|uniref:hypothetical protein n=1 Tax=Streptomyces sp. NPDC046985 TaxID=3155377 RepID=UPI0033EDDC43
MSRARFAFAAHPDALTDLRQLPDEVRDTALLQLQDLVHGHLGAKRLEGRLEGFHKVYIDPAPGQRQWRMVVQFRDAPPSSAHQREVYLVAAGSRKKYEVYHAAHLRTGRHQAPETASTSEARVHAARSRSPRAFNQPTAVPVTPSAAVQPAAAAPRKAPQR